MAEETITLTIDEVNTLKFGIEIQGLDTTMVEARFVIESIGMNLEFPGKFENGEVDVNIPILSRILKPGTFQAKLELVIEGERLFRPMDIDVELVQPVSVAATLGEATVKVSDAAKKHAPKKKLSTNGDTSPSVTASVVASRAKRPDELIADHIIELAKAKNVNALLYTYSNKVLLRESFLPLSIKDVMPVIESACKKHFGKTFTEVVAEHNTETK
jgi:hypothetical protein